MPWWTRCGFIGTSSLGFVAPGKTFWYVNSQGLVEIAVNGGSAAAVLSLALGDQLLID